MDWETATNPIAVPDSLKVQRYSWPPRHFQSLGGLHKYMYYTNKAS